MIKYNMLARKYRAMRNSGGGYNKAAAAPSSSLRLNKLKNKCDPSCASREEPVFKRVPDTSQSEFIAEKRVKQFICNGDTKVTPKKNTCSNGKICNVTKDMTIMSQSTYTETALPGKCVLNQPKKPMIHNIC
jgi:hypothetical protein